MTARGAVDAALIGVVGVGWGLLAPATKAVHAANPAAFDGLSIAVARAAWALPLFLTILAAAWLVERPALALRRWLSIVGAGLVFGLGITVLFSIASLHTSVAHVSFLIGASPVTNTAAAALAFRSPLGRRAWIALTLGLLGVAVLAATRTGGSAGLFGDALMIVWLAGFALYAVLLRTIGSGVSATFTMGAVGTVAMVAVLLAATAVPATLRGVGQVFDGPATAWWFFGEITLGSTIFAQTAYAAAVRRLGVAVATIGAEYTALTVGIAASLTTHEPWSPLTVVAGLLLVGALGVTFVRVPERRIA